MIPEIKYNKLTSKEYFIYDENTLPFNVLDFWKWSTSDLLTNRQRGILAEFLISSALDLTDNPRSEWDEYDLITKDGLKIEIKSASYIQSWEQKEYSKISFGIQPTAKWENNKRTTDKVRQSDLYIFCLLAHKDYKTINPLDLSQWEFYILDTNILNKNVPTQKTITLSSLLLSPIKVTYQNIKEVVSLKHNHHKK